ncbi:ROK family protein [Zavarzinia sp.]|uniref:ROK family protein n=1 Tax=Zavarzinia sp. TaxID=2027920 RepID=UPI003BB519AE
MRAYRHGIDLGGTKTEIITIDASGREVWRHRNMTPRGDYQALVRNIAGLVLEAEARLGAEGEVGIGLPGALSALTGRVKNANTTELLGQDFAGDLEAALRRPVRLANDADCFALSEASDGAGTGADTVFGVILGTGVGGGVVVQGRLLSGPNSIAGEWGHNPLPWPTDDERPGPVCYCGKHGCIETFLSGPGLALDHQARGGAGLTAREIVALAERGDFAAGESLALYTRRLARALATVINILDPHVIVLGGGLSNVKGLYTDLPALIAPLVFSDSCDTAIRPALHGDSSGVRGAAWLWPATSP